MIADRWPQPRRAELDDDSRRTSMGEMTASIAHEIKQPLAAIVTNANAGLRWLARPNPELGEAFERNGAGMPGEMS